MGQAYIVSFGCCFLLILRPKLGEVTIEVTILGKNDGILATRTKSAESFIVTAHSYIKEILSWLQF
jgi:hypothetical protein